MRSFEPDPVRMEAALASHRGCVCRVNLAWQKSAVSKQTVTSTDATLCDELALDYDAAQRP